MSWEQELAKAYRNFEDLVEADLLTAEEAAAARLTSQKYQFLLPQYYASLIDKNDPNCPIRLQAIPHISELTKGKKEIADPLQDLKYQPAQRITHRYENRVLLHLTPNCSMYCRFCFRKSLLNELKTDMFSGGLTEAVKYIEKENKIEEVIFSGGDPFMVGEEIVKQVLKDLEKTSHIKRVRFHTRVPVTLPSRVTPSFVEALGSSRFTPVVVTHFNHPKEITRESSQAIFLLKKKTVLLNQSVLLNRVNDSSDILVELSQKLFEMGILPYYLHQLDPSQGTQAFQVGVEEGKRIWNEMKRRLPGYLVPRYVVDIVGEPYKREVIGLGNC